MQQEEEWMSLKWRAKTIGSTILSAYLDCRLPSLYTPIAAPFMALLDSRASALVVYVSFSKMAACSLAQVAELAFSLRGVGKAFLWVVCTSDAHKLLEGFTAATAEEEEEEALPWCPQLDVLACVVMRGFMTYCGWNSTTEGTRVGMPIVGVPQWTDQPTNALYIEGVWRVGEGEADAAKVTGREEVERRVLEVTEGESGEEMRRRSRICREKAKVVVGEGGSPDRNMVELMAKYCSE